MDKARAKAAAGAAGKGDLKTVKAAVTADPAIAGHWQVLMNACHGGHAEVVAFLLDHGADVNVLAPTAHRYRPLHRTVEFKKTAPKTAGHTETVRLLLEHGADPMLRGSYYLVDAVTVAAMGCTEYVPVLLERVDGDLDLYTACAIADHERVARILAESPTSATQADADSRDGSWLPLQYCARCNAGGDEDRLTTATLLLGHGADPATALDQACWADNGAIADLLLERGARLGDDDTPNHLACDGQFDVLESLLRHDAIDMNGTRGTAHHGGYNPLGCAVNMRSVQGVTWFLDHGCDPNEVMSQTGETALHVAVNSGAGVPLLRLLVERGVDVGRRDAAGQTALDLARSKKRTKLIEFLAER
ncbi:MAG: ankyrin repeat domain-containing protein [Spirochaetaceae bacterium]|nr:ankyrin repeat domain-containing protein [Spirochaetaceae bacterium]